MKDVFKGAAVKIVSMIIVIALIAGAVFLGYRYWINKKTSNFSKETKSNIELVQEMLETTAELNTADYLCTEVITQSDSKKFKDWTIPFTTKSFVVQYDGTIKAGIKDLTQAKVSESGNTITIALPAVEITSVELDEDSFKVIDEKNSIFNSISIEDLNLAQIELEEDMQSNAINKGILDMAKSNAEAVISGMFAAADYEVKIEWQ